MTTERSAPQKTHLLRDLCAGFVMIVAGAGAVTFSLNNPIGTLADIGPSFFPVVLGSLLTGTGIIIAAAAVSARPTESVGAVAQTWPDWRGCAAITLGLVAFIGFGRFFGLAPAVFSCAFISALGDRTATKCSALILAAELTVFSCVLFVYLLHIPFPIWQW